MSTQTFLLQRRTRVLAVALTASLLAGQFTLAAPAFAAAPSTITVETTADGDSTDACTTPRTVLGSPVTLRNALCVANNLGGSVSVDVPAGTYRLAANGSGPLVVGTTPGADISITGASGGATIVGDGTNQVFTLDPMTVGGVAVSMSDLTVTGGVDNVYGGGGIIGGSAASDRAADSLHLSDVVITGNRANTTGSATNNSGGGVQFIGGSLTIVDSVISDNSSGSSAGGGVAYQAVGIAGESLTISRSTFTGNSTTSSDSQPNGGGALVVDDVGGGATIAISGSHFEDNTVANSAGPAVGSALWQRGGTLSLIDSVVTENTATGSAPGGALHIDGGSFDGHFMDLSDNRGGAALASSATPPLTTIAATNNWWGCGGDPAAAGCEKVVGVPTSAYTPYLALSVTPATNPIVLPAQTSIVTASVLKNSAGTAIPLAKVGFLAGLPIAWSAPVPAGATLSSANSVLADGLATTTFTANSAVGVGSVTATVDGVSVVAPLAVHLAPTITSGTAAGFVAGVSNSFPITTTGYPVPTLTQTGTLPTGVTFTPSVNGTATLSGTPAAGSGREYPIEITASNGVGAPFVQRVVVTVSEEPTFTSAADAVFSTDSAGSFTVTAGGFPIATPITKTGALPTGVTFVDNGDGTATLSGTPAARAGGSYPLTFAVANGVGLPAEQSFVLTVNQPAAVTTQPANVMVADGSTATFTAAASGFPVPTVQWQQSTDGTVFTDVVGATSPTMNVPAVHAQSGTSYRAVFSNGTTATSANATLTVYTPVVFTSAASAAFTVNGLSQSFPVTTSGSPSATLSVSGAPSWLTFTGVVGSGTRTLQGTPPVGSGGTHIVTILASNGHGLPATQTFTLTVNEAATISSGTAAGFVAGVNSSFPITTTGYPVPTLTQSGALPTGVTFTDAGTGTATLSGTPAPRFGGEHIVEITASNGVGAPFVQNVVVTVSEESTFTSAADAVFSTDSAGSFTVTAGGFPVATQITQTGALPTGVTFVDNGNGTATLSGTPAARAGGTYPLTFAVANGVGRPAEQTFVLTVNQPTAVTTQPANITVRDGSTATFTAAAIGFPVPTVQWQQSTDGGTAFTDIAGETAATLSVAPVLQAQSGTSYRAVFSNGTTATSANATLTVYTPAAFTSAASAAFTVNGLSQSFPVTTSGSPNATLSMSGAPSWLTIAGVGGTGTGTLQGTPPAGSGGTHIVTLTAMNGFGLPVTQTFTLTVNEAATITSPAAATFAIGTTSTFTISMGAAYPRKTTTTLVGALPAGLDFVPHPSNGSATITGAPTDVDDAGEHIVTLTSDNGIAPVATQSLTITITRAPVITLNPLPHDVAAGAGVTFEADAIGYPAPTVQWQIQADGTGAFVDIAGETRTTLSLTASTALSGNAYRAVFANGVSTASTPATLTVGTIPVISSDAAATFTRVSGSLQSFTVRSTSIPDAVLAVSGTQPTWLNFTDNGDGSGTLAGTPDGQSAGVHTFGFTATNKYGAASVQAFTLTVLGAPAITSAAAAAFEVGVAGTVTITTGHGFPATTSLAATGTLPSGLSFVDQGDGTALLSGTPAATTGGTHDLTVVARNSAGASAPQQLVVSVSSAPSLTSADSATFVRGVDSTFTMSTTDAFPTAGVISAVGTLPTGVTLTDNGDGTATLAGSTVDASGDFALMVRATNGVGADATQSFTLHLVDATPVPLPVVLPTSDGALTGSTATPTPGGAVQVAGGGFAPGSTVTFGVYSTPRTLATAIADASGEVHATLTMPTDLTGAHTIVAAGIDRAGNPLFLSWAVTITPATDSGASSIAKTGQSVELGLAGLVAMLLLGAGTILMFARRRRTFSQGD